jgi:cell division septum initiation protein DivIVA
VENEPRLFEDAGEMVEYLAQALKQTSREATILLYAPALDSHLQKMAERVDRVFCIYSEQAPKTARRPRQGSLGPRKRWRHTHELALEVADKTGRAQEGGQHQGPGAGNSQVDTGEGETIKQLHEENGQLKREIELLKTKIRELEARLAQ